MRIRKGQEFQEYIDKPDAFFKHLFKDAMDCA